MARRADELVNAIRDQRRRVHEATDALLAGSGVPSRIRRSPLPWLVGAGVLGVVVGRWLVPSLVRSGRRRLEPAFAVALRERLQATLKTAAMAALGKIVAHGANGSGAAPAAAPSGAPSSSRPVASDPALSTQPPTS